MRSRLPDIPGKVPNLVLKRHLHRDALIGSGALPARLLLQRALQRAARDQAVAVDRYQADTAPGIRSSLAPEQPSKPKAGNEDKLAPSRRCPA